MLEFKWLKGDEDDLSEAHKIREIVFVDEQNVPKEEDDDEEGDRNSLHMLMLEDEKPIGTGRIVLTGEHFTIGRFAILKEHRGKGYGKLGMAELTNKAYDLGSKEQIIHAQYYIKDLYGSLGYKQEGEPFMDAGIKHITMRHKGRI